MELRIEDCTDATFALIAPRLRDEDQEEWRLWAGDTAEGLVASGWKLPSGAGTLTRIGYSPEGTPLAVWGVSPVRDQVGWVWLVATPEALPVAHPMHRYLHAEFDVIKGMYPFLQTSSWIRNPVHHRWLRWLGFKQAGRSVGSSPERAIFLNFTYGEL